MRTQPRRQRMTFTPPPSAPLATRYLLSAICYLLSAGNPQLATGNFPTGPLQRHFVPPQGQLGVALCAPRATSCRLFPGRI